MNGYSHSILQRVRNIGHMGNNTLLICASTTAIGMENHKSRWNRQFATHKHRQFYELDFINIIHC